MYTEKNDCPQKLKVKVSMAENRHEYIVQLVTKKSWKQLDGLSIFRKDAHPTY